MLREAVGKKKSFRRTLGKKSPRYRERGETMVPDARPLSPPRPPPPQPARYACKPSLSSPGNFCFPVSLKICLHLNLIVTVFVLICSIKHLESGIAHCLLLVSSACRGFAVRLVLLSNSKPMFTRIILIKVQKADACMYGYFFLFKFSSFASAK